MKCHNCPICNGYGCIGELPGMGGFNYNINFQNNCEAWNRLAFLKGMPYSSFSDYTEGILNSKNLSSLPVRLGPMTGGVENVGYNNEKAFYFDLINFAHSKGIALSIGDGCPDCKLKYGIEAIKNLNSSNINDINPAVSKAVSKYEIDADESSCDIKASASNSDIKAAVFIKPYPNDKIFERIEWSKPIASHIGIDIDSYNIITMRKKVKLEKKDASQLCKIKSKIDVPFIIKGIFTSSDIDLVKKVKPEIAFISNHGGRVENRIGSTADFLDYYAEELSSYCKEIWVDGGIRTEKDVKTALALGANQVLIGRPVISAMIKSK